MVFQNQNEQTESTKFNIKITFSHHNSFVQKNILPFGEMSAGQRGKTHHMNFKIPILFLTLFLLASCNKEEVTQAEPQARKTKLQCHTEQIQYDHLNRLYKYPADEEWRSFGNDLFFHLKILDGNTPELNMSSRSKALQKDYFKISNNDSCHSKDDFSYSKNDDVTTLSIRIDDCLLNNMMAGEIVNLVFKSCTIPNWKNRIYKTRKKPTKKKKK